MTRDQWLAERIRNAEEQVAANAEDSILRLLWTGYMDAYRHTLECAPRWEPEPCGHEPEPTFVEDEAIGVDVLHVSERMAAYVREMPILRPLIYGHGTLPEPVSRYGMAEHDRRMDRLEHDS